MATIKSIEEKAKAYDEAKARMSKAWNDNRCTLGFMNEIFPEFKESEDERIRNLIYCLIRDRSDNGKLLVNNGCTVEKALAWIEKQGQHNITNKVEPRFKVGDFVKNVNHHKQPIYKVVDIDKECYICISDDVTLGDNTVVHFTFDNPYLRLVEQKTVDWSKEDEDNLNSCLAKLEIDIQRWGNHGKTMVDGDEKLINWLKFLKDRVQPQPKQEWSDADENTLLDTINTLRSCGRCSTDRALWLMSLKNRILPQSKTEWSEEDEQLYNDLSDTYYYNDEDYPEETYQLMLKRVLDWMDKRAKSLRPQSHWKPSDLQIEALESATENCAYSEYQDCLRELAKQLKKLKGE